MYEKSIEKEVLVAFLKGCQLLLLYMKRAKEGRRVLIGSLVGCHILNLLQLFMKKTKNAFS